MTDTPPKTTTNVMSGTVALVTGAGSGIGRAAALLLTREGAAVAALGRTASDLEEVVTAIRAEGDEATPIVADIADAAAMATAMEMIGAT